MESFELSMISPDPKKPLVDEEDASLINAIVESPPQ